MNHNDVIISDAIWRQFPTKLRQDLRRALGRKSAIVSRQVLDIARGLCHGGAYELVLMFYDGLDGTPPTPYKGCGLGLLMRIRHRSAPRSWCRPSGAGEVVPR